MIMSENVKTSEAPQLVAYCEDDLIPILKKKLLEYLNPKGEVYYHQYDCYKTNYELEIFGNLFSGYSGKKIVEDDDRFSVNTSAIFQRHWKFQKDIEIRINCTYQDVESDIFLDFTLKEIGLTKKQTKAIERKVSRDNWEYAKEYHYLTLRKKGDFFGLF